MTRPGIEPGTSALAKSLLLGVMPLPLGYPVNIQGVDFIELFLCDDTMDLYSNNLKYNPKFTHTDEPEIDLDAKIRNLSVALANEPTNNLVNILSQLKQITAGSHLAVSLQAPAVKTNTKGRPNNKKEKQEKNRAANKKRALAAPPKKQTKKVKKSDSDIEDSTDDTQSSYSHSSSDDEQSEPSESKDGEVGDENNTQLGMDVGKEVVSSAGIDVEKEDDSSAKVCFQFPIYAKSSPTTDIINNALD
ncbi:hypothetical protein Pst134EB_022199 [Puccinia striiformis f. sp. tritici]|nr:hypothetical protein Pst134EB_022199 [Puccinia striiformis f. sp. tritici]